MNLKEKNSISDQKIHFYTSWLRRHPIKRTITYFSSQRIGRNDKCVCNSGLKFKHCCWKKHIEELARQAQNSPELENFQKKEAKYYNKKYKKITKND